MDFLLYQQALNAQWGVNGNVTVEATQKTPHIHTDG